MVRTRTMVSYTLVNSNIHKDKKMTPFIKKLLIILAKESNRIDPYSPYEVPAKFIADAIMEETGLTKEQINKYLDEFSKD